MANKLLIIGVVAVVLVAGIAGAILLLSNQGSSDEKRADFVATSLSLNSENFEAGQTVVATIEMKNIGNADGEYDVRMFLDGVQVNHTMISLGAGNSTTVSLSVDCTVAGNSTIKVEDKTATFTCVDTSVAGNIIKLT